MRVNLKHTNKVLAYKHQCEEVLFSDFDTLNVLEYQQYVCVNGVPKSCLFVSSDDRKSIKGHHAKYNSYTDLLTIQLLLCRVVNCSPVQHLYRMFYFYAFKISQNVLRNQSCRELTFRVYIPLFLLHS